MMIQMGCERFVKKRERPNRRIDMVIDHQKNPHTLCLHVMKSYCTDQGEINFVLF